MFRDIFLFDHVAKAADMDDGGPTFQNVGSLFLASARLELHAYLISAHVAVGHVGTVFVLGGLVICVGLVPLRTNLKSKTIQELHVQCLNTLPIVPGNLVLLNSFENRFIESQHCFAGSIACIAGHPI